MVTVGNQGRDDRYIRLWQGIKYFTSRGEQIVWLSRFRQSVSFYHGGNDWIDFLMRTIRQEKEGIVVNCVVFIPSIIYNFF